MDRCPALARQAVMAARDGQPLHWQRMICPHGRVARPTWRPIAVLQEPRPPKLPASLCQPAPSLCLQRGKVCVLGVFKTCPGRQAGSSQRVVRHGPDSTTPLWTVSFMTHPVARIYTARDQTPAGAAECRWDSGFSDTPHQTAQFRQTSALLGRCRPNVVSHAHFDAGIPKLQIPAALGGPWPRILYLFHRMGRQTGSQT